MERSLWHGFLWNCPLIKGGMKLFSIRRRREPQTAQANVRDQAPQKLRTGCRPMNQTVLPFRIGPGLGIDKDGVHYLEPAIEMLTAGKTVFLSELCPAPMAAEGTVTASPATRRRTA